MKIIDEKKIHPYATIALLYVSFALSQWYVSRGAVALASEQMSSMSQMAVMFNEVVAVIIGGLLPLIVYELITAFVFAFSRARIGASADNMRYALRYFYIGANLAAFGLKALYMISPLVSVYGNVIIDVFVTALFAVWFLFYSAKHYVEKPRWGAMLYQLGGTFIIVYGLLTVAQLIMGVIA